MMRYYISDPVLGNGSFDKGVPCPKKEKKRGGEPHKKSRTKSKPDQESSATIASRGQKTLSFTNRALE